MKAVLLLENGSLYEGESFGFAGEKIGEVILNTAVVGYQEIMTDSANAGKILVMTYPLIGNYGVAAKFNESAKCRLAGLLIKEPSRIYSNWQAEGSLGDFLKKETVVCAAGIDTRTLAVELRDNGQMLGIISSKNFKKENLLKKLKTYKKADFIKKVSTAKRTDIPVEGAKARIGILDLGVKNSFIGQLKFLGCSVTLLPYNTPAEKIISGKFDGLVISNGPEGDSALEAVAQNVKKLLGKLPVMGISAGHEVIAMALGGKIKKMKLGHNGLNYPVKGLGSSQKGEITVQNHSFVVDEDSMKGKEDISVTLRNINDDSIEAMESKTSRFISTQFYPVSPGSGEANDVFVKFLKLCRREK